MTSNDTITFDVNHSRYKVSSVDPKITLNSWLRSQAGMVETKWMCNEGGCGSCVVLLKRHSQRAKSVNSCLVPLASVDGCSVYTTKAFGSSYNGYNKIQSAIAKFGATQCGYCTPGFIMSMHGLLEKNTLQTKQAIEDNFDGNICRCTGYRSILDAMKTFASDAGECGDIEDILPSKCRLKQSKQLANLPLRSLRLQSSRSTWVRPLTFEELKLFFRQDPSSFKFVCGNTASGIFKTIECYQFYVDVSQIQELNAVFSSVDAIEFGASVTLNEVVDYLDEHKKESLIFEPIAAHIKQVASNPIRNVGSWAGNLMIQHEHKEFPSDICTLLEAFASAIKVYDFISGSYLVFDADKIYGPEGLMQLDMRNKIIVSMTLPKINSESMRIKTFKITPRSQNSHAYVNAGFCATLNADKSIINEAKLVFGGLSASFHRSLKTESYLSGKSIKSNHTLQGALLELSNEIKPVCSDTFKVNLALGLFYKFYLSLCDPSQLGPGIASGIDSLQRPVSTGTQEYKTDPSIYPVSENIPKILGPVQTSGEISFISDLPSSPIDLYCDVVLSSVANADIESIDKSRARAVPGVVDFITWENFPPGVTNTYLYPYDTTQQIISSGHVTYAGQVVAIVIAKSLDAAREASALVEVKYKNQKKPLITIDDAIAADSIFPLFIPDLVSGDPDEAVKSAPHVVSGEYKFGHQYHFYMETMVCRAQGTEQGGFRIEASTQCQTDLQAVISHAFSVPINKVEVTTKQIGGAFGGKSTNSFLPSCIAALVSHVTNQPATFHASLETCMRMLGTRTPFTIKYKVGFGDEGTVHGMDVAVYTNSGITFYDGEADDDSLFEHFGDGAYFCPNRRFKRFMVKTNIPPTSWCRAPGSLQLTAAWDMIVEHVASYLKRSPLAVKLANLYKVGQQHLCPSSQQKSNFVSMYNNFLTKYKIGERMSSIETFNQNNRWKKKGLAVTPMKYFVGQWAKFGVLISIYSRDGSVVVSHGGIESGQGLNTKVAQVVAYKLGIPLDMVTVQRSNTITSANSSPTGGSIASESVCRSALDCCEILNDRIQPIRAEMKADSTWSQIISRCFSEGVHLSTTSMIAPKAENNYPVYGVTAAEVEYDVITGERQIVQVDLMFDCGVSMNPSVDIGQVEGAFIMGVGFWLTEKMVYDQTSGQLLTAGTWDYKPPASKDIPITWNIELLPDAPNPVGVLRSKTSGEPPMCMSVCVPLALKRAVEATRKDRGINDYFPLPLPATVDALHNSSSLSPLSDFILQ